MSLSITEILKLRDSQRFWGRDSKNSLFHQCFRQCIDRTQRSLWQQPEVFDMAAWADAHNSKFKDTIGFFPVSKTPYGAWGMKTSNGWHTLQTTRMPD